MSLVDARAALLGLDPASYVPHAVHGPGRTYTETNCYTDILVELLHARGDEPLAAMGCTLRSAFEGDQFTFFKPAPGDLEALYGLDLHEIQPWRGVGELAAEQLRAGRTIVVELDAFFLPDTAATDYRRRHVKTTVVVEAIDLEARTLTYFHNAGLYALDGEDFDGILAPALLPPYVEVARFDAGVRLEGDALRLAARERTRDHLARRPAGNPFAAFGERLAADLPALLAGSEQDYHDYAFATVRMAGSAFELGADHVDWLLGAEGAPAAAALRRVVEGCKVLSFRLARRRAFDPAERVAALAGAWDEAMGHLTRALA